MSLKYRAEIDGLRAIAVLSVIFYHAFPSVVSGGFVGVDVFFVISGYLITNILLKELQAEKFSIVRFYERRARRIMPALFFMIIVCIPFGYYYLLPDDINSFYKSIVSVSTFTSNFLFASESGYFSPNVELKPFLHTWTLAVEEQYYIFFPLIMFAAWKVGKKFTLLLVVGLAVLSLILAQKLSVSDPTNAFYLLHTRAWELLFGAIGAFISNKGIGVKKSLANIMSILGVLMIILSVLVFDKTMPYPSLYTLLPVAGSFLILVFCNNQLLVGKILSITKIRFFGLISYSAYLWHQPIFAFYRYKSISEPRPLIMILLIATTILIAYFSWRVIEKPFREKGVFTAKQIFTFTAVGSVAFITFGVSGVTYPSHMNRFSSNETYANVNHRLRGNFGLSKKCEREFHNYVECRTSDKPEILVWGDSYAMQIVPAIIASNPSVKLIQATVSQCEPIIGFSRSSTIFGAQNCILSNDRVIDMVKKIPSIKNVVISSPYPQLAASNYVTDRSGRSFIASPNDSYNMILATVNKLKELGKNVTIVAPTPEDKEGKDIGFCLLKTSSLNLRRSVCDFSSTDISDKQKEIYRRINIISQDTNVIWLKDAICSNGICQSSIGDTLIYRDKGHLSYEGSRIIGKKIGMYNLIIN
jgi:peptidoglycan/LPS O-acetylase OafA/YrhL